MSVLFGLFAAAIAGTAAELAAVATQPEAPQARFGPVDVSLKLDLDPTLSAAQLSIVNDSVAVHLDALRLGLADHLQELHDQYVSRADGIEKYNAAQLQPKLAALVARNAPQDAVTKAEEFLQGQASTASALRDRTRDLLSSTAFRLEVAPNGEGMMFVLVERVEGGVAGLAAREQVCSDSSEAQLLSSNILHNWFRDSVYTVTAKPGSLKDATQRAKMGKLAREMAPLALAGMVERPNAPKVQAVLSVEGTQSLMMSTGPLKFDCFRPA